MHPFSQRMACSCSTLTILTQADAGAIATQKTLKKGRKELLTDAAYLADHRLVSAVSLHRGRTSGLIESVRQSVRWLDLKRKNRPPFFAALDIPYSLCSRDGDNKIYVWSQLAVIIRRTQMLGVFRNVLWHPFCLVRGWKHSNWTMWMSETILI